MKLPQSRDIQQMKVAPHTGAWIETEVIKKYGIPCVSHPTRVRGLKHSLTET